MLVNYSKPAFEMQIWIVWISLMESVMRTACASNKKKVLFQATENWLWEGWPKGEKLKASTEWLLKRPSEFPNFLIQMQETKAAAFIQGESLAKGKCSYDIVIIYTVLSWKKEESQILLFFQICIFWYGSLKWRFPGYHWQERIQPKRSWRWLRWVWSAEDRKARRTNEETSSHCRCSKQSTHSHS